MCLSSKRSYLTAREKNDPYIRHRVHLYLALFPIFWLTVLVREGMHLATNGEIEGWKINGLPADMRLRRYLARSMAWPEMGFSHQEEALTDVIFFPSA